MIRFLSFLNLEANPSTNVADSFLNETLPISVAHPAQFGFQTPASPIAEGIVAFHDDLRIFLTGILVFVRYILGVAFYRFGAPLGTRRPPVERFVHAATLEIVWTLIPAALLIVIAIPSFSLLYSIDEVIEPLFTVKVIGHQWYWSYEFLDPEVVARLYNDSLDALAPAAATSDDALETSVAPLHFVPSGSAAFDSYRLAEDDLFSGDSLTNIRLLTVDNHLFLPTERHLRARVTSADVLHSWAIPSLGVKLDACPGRLNQVSIFIKREGIYYGQCSEICGVNHGFRPIGIVSLELFAGLTPTTLDLEPILTALQAIALE